MEVLASVKLPALVTTVRPSTACASAGFVVCTLHGNASFRDLYTIRVVGEGDVETLVHGEKILIATVSSPLRPPVGRVDVLESAFITPTFPI